MKIKLSTTWTFFWKYIIPILVVGLMIQGLLFSYEEHELVGVGMMIIPIIGSIALIYYGCLRLKNVQIDDHFLYVNNFTNSIQIPLEDVKGVSEKVINSPRIIYVEFKKETEFGKK